MIKKIILLFFVLLLGIPAEAAIKVISLPTPKSVGTISLEETLYRRRSERTFGPHQLTNDQISQLLWATQGITDQTWGFRTAPSSGSCYPLEIYLAKNDGIFHYIPQSGLLEQLDKVDQRLSLVRASLGQAFIGDAPAVFIIAVSFEKSAEKYGRRSERYVHMEAGHAAQNLLLQATALGLNACPVGSFWDNAAARALNLPPDLEPRYLIPVGYAK